MNWSELIISPDCLRDDLLPASPLKAGELGYIRRAGWSWSEGAHAGADDD